MRFSTQNPMKIGTRGSPLALVQAHETRARLGTALDLPEAAFEIAVIKTTGDRVQDRPLSEIGGKGLFTKEIEDALLSCAIDIAVHSMKDMPVLCPEGLSLDCFLPREDVRDGFVSHKFKSIAELPQGAKIGSSSLRRRAQLLNRRPDLEVVEFRGNVQTRLRKLKEGVADATFLACAGLNRLGMGTLATPIETVEILPAIAQGCIGIERRANDGEICKALALINDDKATIQLAAERALLAGLDGSCQTPIAGLAMFDGAGLVLHCEVLRPDGSEKLSDRQSFAPEDAEATGRDMAARLRSRMGDDFF